MYEKVNKFEKNIILTPWLGVNYKISYYSDQTKEMLYSLGINLMTGNLIEEFQESLREVDLDPIMTEGLFQFTLYYKAHLVL